MGIGFLHSGVCPRAWAVFSHGPGWCLAMCLVEIIVIIMKRRYMARSVTFQHKAVRGGASRLEGGPGAGNRCYLP